MNVFLFGDEERGRDVACRRRLRLSRTLSGTGKLELHPC